MFLFNEQAIKGTNMVVGYNVEEWLEFITV